MLLATLVQARRIVRLQAYMNPATCQRVFGMALPMLRQRVKEVETKVERSLC